MRPHLPVLAGVSLALAGATPAVAAPIPIYTGRTSAGRPVVVQRSGDGRRVDAVWISWAADCQSGGYIDFGDQLVRFPVSRSGHFGNAFDQPFTLDGGAVRTTPTSSAVSWA